MCLWLRPCRCVVLQAAAEGEVQGYAAGELLVAVGKQGFFNASGGVFFFQHVLQASRACLVADASEGFDVFGLCQAFLQVLCFFLALRKVQDGVLCFAEGAVEGLAEAGEALLVAGFGFAARDVFFVVVQEWQGDVGTQCGDGVLQDLQDAVGAGREVCAEAKVGVVVAFGDLDVADVLLQAVLGGAQVGSLCQQVGGDGGIYRRDGEAAEAGFLGDDAR